MLRFKVSFVVVLMAMFHMACGNIARESYKNVAEVLKIVQRIEDQLLKEERLRDVTDIVRIDSTLDRLNTKLEKLMDVLEVRNPNIRSSPLTSVAAYPGDIDGRLRDIDSRMGRLENAMEKMENIFEKADLGKLDEIDKRSSQLSGDLNQKLRKMMNIITALYEMNKEMKANYGGRSGDVISTTPPETPRNNFAAEYFVENLEEMERKIKEQFSILSNQIRNEITGLKIVASSVSNGCSETTPNEEDELASFRSSQRAPRRQADHREKSSGHSPDSTESRLDNLVQSLGRTTREIREEIHQGMQAIDHKLSNLTKISHNCEDLQASDSIVDSVRVSREFSMPAEQQLDGGKGQRKHESCSRNAKNVPSPKSCSELRAGGVTCDGIYVIFPKNVRAVRVLCDMTTDGGGWTVLMRRGEYGDKMTTFHKNWLSYKNGFGDMEGEFWLGNDVLHLLTLQDDNVLKVHLEAFDDSSIDMTYSSFSVSNESDSYTLSIGPAVGATSSASNSLRYHNKHPFSTFDKKNDKFEQNCAATYKGGWWFNGCYFGFLTGEYFRADDKRENWQGILWYDWKGNAALKGAYMMARPKSFAA